MKKLVCLFLVIGMLVSGLAITAVAETPAKEFVVDGKLDPWYLTVDTTPVDDMNDYHMTSDFFDPYVITGGGNASAPYEEPETLVEAYTAYDDTYVYFYVKVWDDDLRYWNNFQPDDYDLEGNTNCNTGDSIEIWFDPDPNSYKKYVIKDPNDIEEGKKHYFSNNTKDPEQGDTHFRMQAALDPNKNTVTFRDYHDYRDVLDENGNNVMSENGLKVREPILRPGYNGLRFGEYISNPENACRFTFDNEPVIVDEWSGKEVSSGYGLEVRLPRNDDDSNTYYFNIVVNNSSIYSAKRYALALGSAWFTSYISGMTVEYSDVNPFFAQEIVIEDPEKPEIPEDPKDPEVPVTPGDALDLGDVNGDDTINAKDALVVLKIAVNKVKPTDAEKVAADVNKDNTINAKDALEILKHSVGKPSCIEK